MTTYLWILFTATVFGGVTYLVLRWGVPTSRVIASAGAAIVCVGMVGGLYAFKRYEARLVAERSTPIERVQAQSAETSSRDGNR